MAKTEGYEVTAGRTRFAEGWGVTLVRWSGNAGDQPETRRLTVKAMSFEGAHRLERFLNESNSVLFDLWHALPKAGA